MTVSYKNRKLRQIPQGECPVTTEAETGLMQFKAGNSTRSQEDGEEGFPRASNGLAGHLISDSGLLAF